MHFEIEWELGSKRARGVCMSAWCAALSTIYESYLVDIAAAVCVCSRATRSDPRPSNVSLVVRFVERVSRSLVTDPA